MSPDTWIILRSANVLFKGSSATRIFPSGGPGLRRDTAEQCAFLGIDLLTGGHTVPVDERVEL